MCRMQSQRKPHDRNAVFQSDCCDIHYRDADDDDDALHI